MANRPVFCCTDHPPYFIEENTEFVYCPGFSIQQQRKSISNLQSSFLKKHPGINVLEISTRAEEPLGVMLSAFNLQMEIEPYGRRTVEQFFQGGKVFNGGITAIKALDMAAKEAKKYVAGFSGKGLSHFELAGKIFPLEPKTFFYDWLYLNALNQNENIRKQLTEYQAFTDIAFNPNKSINCQARSAAIYVSLQKRNLLSRALENQTFFRDTVYSTESGEADKNSIQLSLF